MILQIWGGVGGFRNQFMSFTEQGHGFGLIQHGFVREFLLQLYAEMAHDCTRGTWTCFESRGIPDWTPAGGYTTPSQSIVPLHVKWMLVFEEPHTNALTLCKTCPRSWLQSGELIAVEDAPTSHGRISYNISSSENTRVHAAVKLDPPPVGSHAPTPALSSVTLTLRAPWGRIIAGASVGEGVGGMKKVAFDADAESVEVPVAADGKTVLVEVDYA